MTPPFVGEFRGLHNPPPVEGLTPVDMTMKFSALDIIPMTASAAARAEVDSGDEFALEECSDVAELGDEAPTISPSFSVGVPPPQAVAGVA